MESVSPLQVVYDLNEHPSPSPSPSASQSHKRALDFLGQNQNPNPNHDQMGRESGSQPSELYPPPPSGKRSSIPWAEKNSSKGGGGDGKRARWMCQVEGCSEDGSGRTQLKEYHRRHHVCPTHARAPSVILRGSGTSGSNTVHRFCQQCSKFHALNEFDQDKRSCRRRLNRHNNRRRMSNRHNATAATGPFSLTGFDPDQVRGIIAALLHIISTFELARPDPARDQEFLHRFLASLATSSLSVDISELLQRSAPPASNPGSSSIPPLDLNAAALPSSVDTTDGRIRDFDLNDPIYQVENENEPEPDYEHETDMGDFGNTFHNLSQPSSNDSDSSSVPSHASSGNTQGQTGKVVFKLFGKNPADSPPNLHPEILTWLSHCPIEMESYMKPGCIILTLYLCLADSAWHELAHNLAYWIERLILIPDHNFWRTGWVYATLQDQMVFIYNGRIVLEGPLISEHPYQFEILNISPIAVSSTSNVTFYLKGYGLSQSSARFFVAYDGEYLVQGALQDFTEETGNAVPGIPEAQCVSFSCTIPASNGRGFIEHEPGTVQIVLSERLNWLREIEEYDHRGLFFPFIVADEAMCVEIRELESEIDLISGQQNVAMEFLQEMGWLLRRAHRQSDVATYPTAFSVLRYRLLMSFAMGREWCSVLKKLLDILFNGDIHLEGCSAEEFVLRESLLFEAVRMKSKPLVAFLLRYKARGRDCQERYLFTPDMVGPCTDNVLFITPLHLVATIDGAESVLDALTDDPGKIGMKSWMTSRGGDARNQTPAEWARERAHTSYTQLVQNKIDLISKKAQVDAGTPDISIYLRGHLDIEKGFPHCNCHMQQKQVTHRSAMSGFLVHRPAILTLVSIAAVCVCVGIILKTLPVVRYISGPFLWDSLERGTM